MKNLEINNILSQIGLAHVHKIKKERSSEIIHKC